MKKAIFLIFQNQLFENSPFFEQENVPAHSDKYVLSYVKGADISIVESDLSFE